jgi:hypothetical protein
MKLAEHVDHIRTLIYGAFNNQFSRLGVSPAKMMDIDRMPSELLSKRRKVEVLITNHTDETGSYEQAREKALDELTFTLFNRLAAVKVMEAHQLFPPIVTKEAQHGERSFGHKAWLEQHYEMRNKELEGLREYLKDVFNLLGESIPLFHKDYPYALLPNAIELNEIIDAFNDVEQNNQIEDNIWQSDDILGWLYESYNSVKKQAHKDSGDKTEYHKVSLQSQVYTPRWVVEFLVNNSLGKLYLEMHPDSKIKDKYKIANAPTERVREIKPLNEIKLIDPASGSGNFLLYAFSIFYDLYIDQIENYGADYDEDDLPKLIIENNLHGIDLDDRAVQLAQLGLWIKAKQKNRRIGKLNFNVISSDFFLPDFDFVYPVFEAGISDKNQLSIVREIWKDLQQAHKFGSLVKIEEKLSVRLHGLLEQSRSTLFGQKEMEEYVRFKTDFFTNLEQAVERFGRQQNNSFLADKTSDAITFLKLITQKYDIATANPPYTDSANFGKELKQFIEENYKKPYKFNTNLYATFIKRCYELTDENGKIGLIHPHTFMFIKTFEDVRKFMIEKSHIDVMVDFGLDRVNLFGPGILLDATFYVLSKQKSTKNGVYFNLSTNLQEKYKKGRFFQALDDFVDMKNNDRVFQLEQSKLKIIKSWPFIYWISDEFREKFKSKSIDEVLKVRQGIATGNNNRCLRFWWEVNKEDISGQHGDGKKWVGYSKGGPYQKWFGNMWLVVDFGDEGYNYLLNSGNHLPSKEFYFLEGLTYSASGSKGASFRYLPKNNVFDVGGSCIFPFEYKNVEYSIAFMNSKLCFYITDCLNPTVNTQVGDLKRVPFVIPTKNHEQFIISLSKINIEIIKRLKGFEIFETEYKSSPIIHFGINSEIKKSIRKYIDYDILLRTQVLLNEAINNEKIFEVYDLTEEDKAMVIAKEGKSIGSLPVSAETRHFFLENEIEEFPKDNIRKYIENLPEREFPTAERETIENEFPQLYQSNNDLEEFCIRHQVNPINVCYWFKQSNVIPKQRMYDLAMEFLADLLREILMEDDDGIIPLVPNAGEKVLLDRIEEKFIEKGFTMAQYSSFDNVLGRELNDYLNNHFFRNFSDHLNLFMYLPKTPFIWHLTSGPEQGFDCYIIIYKWNKDRLLRLRSVYIENRERALINRQTDLRNKEILSAAEQTETDKIYKQIKEIESFKQKIDELLEEGYNPILDDGVGKNIAPLQNIGMLPYEVLNAGQLKKYLNADW